MIEIIKVILLGIVEGITEWLPISSTGHLILLDNILKLNVSAEFWEMFLVVIQLGAIIAVIVLYFKRLWPFHIRNFVDSGEHVIDKDKIILWVKILISCIPAAIIGFLFDDWIDARFYNYVVVAIMLIVYGILFILVENRNRGRRPVIRKTSHIGIKEALIIGAAQVLALIPGTSRSGVTILSGITIGMSRKTASEYSFFLAIPVMFGASILKMAKFGIGISPYELLFLVLGMFVAFIVSLFSIKFLLNYVKKHTFRFFGYYRIVLGVIIIVFFFISKLIA